MNFNNQNSNYAGRLGLFFSSLERAFIFKNVPENYKSEIFRNLLGERAVNIITYIKDDEL